MENRLSSGRLFFLGTPTPWANQFLDALQQAGPFTIQREENIAQFFEYPQIQNRVSVVFLEQSAHATKLLSELRASNRKIVLVWFGKNFTKEELQTAFLYRVHTVLENPQAADAKVMQQVTGAIAAAEAAERSEELLFSIKAAVLQIGENEEVPGSLKELRTGLLKLQKHAVTNEFLGKPTPSGRVAVPFYKSQTLADSLLMVQDLERTGELTIRVKKQSLQGKIVFLQGRPVAAQCGETRGLKAMYRMFLWSEPEFSFVGRDPAETPVEETFSLSLREICLEGESLRARFEKIRPHIPPSQVKLRLEPGALSTQTQLDRDAFSTLSSVVELGKVAQILDYNPLPDVVLYECLIGLKKSGLVRVIAG